MHMTTNATNTTYIAANTNSTEVQRRSAISEYAVRLGEASKKALARKGIYSDIIDDVSQEIVAGFLADAEGIMARYGAPQRYAAARATHAAVDFLRRNSAQRGDGVRQINDEWGVLVPVRKVISGDASCAVEPGEDDTMLWEVTKVKHSFEGALVEHLDSVALVDRLLSKLNDDDLELVMLVWVDEYNVGEAAALMRIARETASRRLSKARQRLAAAA
jgi:RNA polymerase sigma factor (sigma-70 family)